MNRKDFFKPTKNKIIITEFVILLFEINILTGIFGGPHLNLFLIFPMILFIISTFYMNPIIASIVIIVSLVIEVVYLYFISCFTTSIYKKYFRRLKNEKLTIP